MSEAQHPIKLVARRTGLSPYVLRIWEQPYRAVEPQRTATNRRRYSAEGSTRDESARSGCASTTSGSLDACVAAVRAFDERGFEGSLRRAATALGDMGVLQRVVAPMAQAIGELWRAGTLTAAHEHFASAALRVWPGNAARPFGAVDGAPLAMDGLQKRRVKTAL